MTDPVRSTLNASATVVLDANGAGRVSVGPQDSAGPANWEVTGVILQTSRPGEAPIPRAQVYLDLEQPANTQGLTYDGSFSQGRASNLRLSRGSRLITVWSGGAAGDVATMTVTGEKW